MFRRPLTSLITLFPGQKKTTSFGSYRAERMEERMQKAVKERQTLARAQAASIDPLSSHLGQRGEVVARTIDRLHQELKQEK